MNTIPDIFFGRGSQKHWQFKKIKREGNVALYSKEQEGVQTIYYETVIIKPHNGYTMGGVTIPPGEHYPNETLFGIRGWCYNEFEKAEQKFNQLLEQYAAKDKG